MKKIIQVEEEARFCDICGKKMGYLPQLYAIDFPSFSYNVTSKNEASGSINTSALFNLNPKKDVCMECIQKALNQTLKELYKK